MKLEFQSQYKTLEHTFKTIREIFSDNDHSIHKARNELKIIEQGGIKTVVKSFKIPHLLNRIVYTFFRKSKAYKSYHNALYLKELGVSTPPPIALIEFFSLTLLADSFFFSVLFDFDFTIRTPLLEPLVDK
jgi:hypothetical protein